MAGHHGRTVIIIPARYASERLPGKPLVDIGGKPMIRHVVERARKAQRADQVIVATDDERIAATVRAFGGVATLTPANIASGSDRIAFVARTLPDAEIIVNVQGDEPFIEPAMIDEAIEPLQDDPAIAVGTLVREIASPEDLDNPAITKVVLDRNGWCLYFSRSAVPHVRGIPREHWLERQTFYRHIGVYVFRHDALQRFTGLAPMPLEQSEKLEQLRILEHGGRIKAVVTRHDSLSIDTEADLARAQAFIGSHHET